MCVSGLCCGVHRTTIVVVAGLLVFVPVEGSGGLHCDDVWHGPSKDNNLGTCITSTKRLETNAADYVFPGLCLAFFALSLVVFPIAFACGCRARCCCGGCDVDVPHGQRSASKLTRKHLRALMALLMMLSVAIAVVMVVGSAALRKGVDDVFVNLNRHVLGYFLAITDQLEATVRDADTGNLTQPFASYTFRAINGYVADIQNTAEEYRRVVATYGNTVAKVGYGAAVLPFAAFSCTVVFAACNVRGGLPSLSTWGYYAIGLVFSLAGCAVLVVGTVFADVVVELDLQVQRQPGLFQWYVIPVCQSLVNFTDLKQEVAINEAALARAFCIEVSKYCSATVAYDTSSPQDVFYCTTSAASASSDCTNFDAASLILAAMFAKTGSNVCNGANCTFAECPVLCGDSTLRDDAATAIALVQAAQRLFNGMELVLPLMACDAIVDRLLRAFDSFPAIRDGLVKMGVACFMTLVGVLMAWAVMLWGERVWFSRGESIEDAGGVSDELEAVADVPPANESEPVPAACCIGGDSEPSLAVTPAVSAVSPAAVAHL